MSSNGKDSCVKLVANTIMSGCFLEFTFSIPFIRTSYNHFLRLVVGQFRDTQMRQIVHHV
jgi:hypothetical protein